MPQTVAEALVEPIARILRSSIDAGDGGTEEQHAVLGAIVAGLFGRADLDVEALAPLAPDAAGGGGARPGRRAAGCGR